MRKQELHPRTAIINKNQKNKSKNSRLDALSWLAQNFPAAFDNSMQIYPLKKGIMDDILVHADKAAQAGISKSKLREAVVVYTRRLDYLACLKSREMRVDLDGNKVIEVTEEEAEHAAQKIKKRVEKSLRNARKVMQEKETCSRNTSTSNSLGSMSKMTHQKPSMNDSFPIYPPRSPSYNTAVTSKPAKTATTIVTHKTTKSYDPDAVARLKEKLGLSNKEQKEAVE